jgi:hypothetical protein
MLLQTWIESITCSRPVTQQPQKDLKGEFLWKGFFPPDKGPGNFDPMEMRRRSHKKSFWENHFQCPASLGQITGIIDNLE